MLSKISIESFLYGNPSLFLDGHVGASGDVQVGAVDHEADSARHPRRPGVPVVGEAVGAEDVDCGEFKVRFECLQINVDMDDHH